MTYGTLIVDFAGTRDEARSFVGENLGLKVGNYPNVGNEGLPTITLIYTSNRKREEGYTRLSSLGWDRESVLDRPYETNKYPSQQRRKGMAA